MTNSIDRLNAGPYTFDPAKDAINLAKHSLSLANFRGFDGLPLVVEDTRYDYGEERFQGRGRIGGHGYCVVYALPEVGVRLISFRRAHDKEMSRYG